MVHEPTPGKGQALRTGVAATAAELLVFLDADLVGLRPGHVDELVRLVRDGGADMACGLFDRGPVANPIFLERLPVLTGQRALHRHLFEQLADDDIRGYRVEAALNSLVAQRELRRADRVLPGLWHRTKEEKLANPVVGFVSKLRMLRQRLLELRAVRGRPGRRAAAASRPVRQPGVALGWAQGRSRGSS